MAASCILCHHSSIDSRGQCRACGCKCRFANEAPTVTTQQGRMSGERLYTLTEIEKLAQVFADDPDRLAAQVTIGNFVQWLQEKED